MKILFLTHRLPYPPLGGAKVRAFHTIEHLGRRHEVTVVAPARSRAEAEAGDALRDHCRELITEVIVHPYGLLRAAACLPTATPSSMGYFHSRELRRRLRRALAATRFDLIMVHSSSVAPAVAEVAGPAKILDFVDMDSQKWLDYAGYKSFPLALGYRIEGHKLARAEARLANAFDLCTCATAREVETLAGLGKASPAEVVPNGVDLNYFAPTDAPYRPDSICFVGRMDYFPNQQCMIDFCAQALPLIRQARPGVTLTIVGAAPRRAVRRLAEIPGVTVTGTVEDVRPFVQASALTVAPLKIARGTQNKVLESMAMGVPVVASTLAAGGVDAVPGEHLLAAADTRGLVEAIVGLLGDPARRQDFARAARARVEARHNWPASMARFDALIERTCGRARVDMD